MEKSLREKAYKRIREKIIFFDLKPGQKIFENEIAERMKMTRTPVREALLMLEHEKLLVRAKRGYIVRKLAPKEMSEYFKMRRLMEDFAIPLILERITPSELKAIENNIKNAEKAIEDENLHDIIRFESEFHEILYGATKSEVFIDTISHLIDKFQWIRAIGLSAEQGARESLNDHKQMLDAIVKGDKKKLAKFTEDHLQHAEQKVSLMQKLFF